MSAKKSIMDLWDYMCLRFKGTTVGEALHVSGIPTPFQKPAATTVENQFEYNPDGEFEDLAKPVMNPMIAFHEALRAKDPKKLPDDNPFKGRTVKVAEAFVFEAKFNADGKMLRDKKVFESLGIRWPAFHRIRRVKGNDQYLETIARTDAELKALPLREAARKDLVKKLTDAKLIEDNGDWFANDGFGSFDSNQYTEFVPMTGGPFYKQLYLTDYLRMHGLAFEAWNHNPLAKRIVELVSQYTFGRRFKVRIKDARKEKAWKDFNSKFNIRESVSQYWVREYCIYGEIMVNKETWQLVDPSTVWDIITDPDNIREVYYYYQSYPTAYQMFTGYSVPGEPGSAKVPGSEYVIRQIPASKILHLKGNCVSNEKRGRSLFFPVLGWLKRVKDLYNAIVVRQWLMSCFIWDDTVKGNQSDIDAHAAQYATMPKAGSTFVHNESVVRVPMPAIEGSGGRGNASGIGEEIIAFIATAIGLPKEFFNVISSGGGSRATALTSAEPFTKVIEDIQAKFESLLLVVAEEAFKAEGLDYQDGDVEFVFPSVTKDTTSETIKNIATGEALGYIAKQTAADMFAGEMNITNYDFEHEQERIDEEARTGLNKTGSTPMPPSGRFGAGSSMGDPTSDPSDAANIANQDEEPGQAPSPIHGNGKVSLSKSLKRI